jgi:hypothetical protein
MDIVTVHTIKIPMSYVGIIAVIQEHAYDHCHGNVSGQVYIYSNPLGDTLKSFSSIEYEFAMRSKREGYSKSDSRKYRNGFIISQMVLEGSETLPVIQRRCRNEIRSNWSIYGKSRIYHKVKHRRWTTMVLGTHGPTPGRPHH